ncbi:hydroxyacylglutathione hydrolase [Stakelama tenebrarum]|uniref:Hydroxyacylglutathione hydrolase n=1 Tax=Stakelama tenebrarum TaxID=2711215 RepID=A0A6G6Y2Y8_9SPHN|nr:hydroxyacylglutathione hydrolase [Sphingosinithalassobacter tenebrarum]QIG79314.1 hydroxyacylglutathione hydrolase [Sphingosinithalassobacter tenebrarum]
MEVVCIPVLNDNYVWLVHEPESRETMVVDPAVADPVLEAAAARGWRISAIWNTHWHPDHTGGNAAIKVATGASVIAPAAEAERIPTADRLVAEGDTVRLGTATATVLEVPAHTAGHIAYHFPDQKMLFIGDTLFAMGCGRLFEGTAAQMFANMRRLSALPPETTVYCAHEYTQANGRFARVAEPDNAAIADRVVAVDAARATGEPTVPTSIALELETNPFMRAADAETLAQLREAKDNFAG